MKFVCGECQAKYQIPDERVAGRKLKIRCRKCGAAIHLRGEHASAVGEPAPSIEWHVAVDGQQHGPYPTEQMASMLRDGDLGWDASVWREGYGDWKDADVSDTLVRAVASIAETRYSAPPEARYSSHSVVPEYDDGEPTRMVQGGPADEELPTRMTHGAFPDDELPTRMVQQHSAPPDDDLQPYSRTAVARQRSVSPTSGVEPVRQRPASIAPSAGLAPAPARRAQSYAPAEGLAPAQRPQSYAPSAGLAPAQRPQSYAPSAGLAPAQRPQSYAPSAGLAPVAPVRPGYAGGDGSGLIDIRALSALTHGSNQPSSMAATRTRSMASSDVMVPMAAPNSPFGNIDSLRPFERPPRRSSKALPIAIVVGSSLIAAAAFLAVFMTRKEAAAVAAVELAAPPVTAAASALQPAEPQPATAGAAEAAPGTEQPAAALAAAVEEPKGEQPAAADDDEADEPAKDSGGGAASAARSGKPRASSKAAKKSSGAAKAKADDEKDDDLLAAREEKPAEAKAAPEPEKPAPAKESPSIDDLLAGKDKADAVAATESKPKPAPPANRSIDDLLDGAVAKKGSSSAAAPSASGGNLPESPARDEVKNAMQALESDVRGCAEGQTLDAPTATVAVTVTSNGRVQSVRVTGNQGAVGSCIAKVVRGAKFSPFSKPQFSFNFPYKLK